MTRDVFAEALAQAEAGEQGAFLSAFADALHAACGSNLDGQIMWIVRALSPRGRSILKELGGWVDYEEQNAKERAGTYAREYEEQYARREELAQLTSRVADLRHEIDELDAKKRVET